MEYQTERAVYIPLILESVHTFNPQRTLYCACLSSTIFLFVTKAAVMRFPSFAFAGLLATIGLLVFAVPVFAQEIVVQAVKAGGVYAVGEKIVWRVSVQGEGAGNIAKVAYVLKKGGLTEIARGEITLTDNAAALETTLDAPGTLLAEFTAAVAGKTLKTDAGAAVAPEAIQPSAPTPADFDTFWKSKVEELAKVPANPVLTKAESGSDTVDYWKITLDNIRGTKIQGQLARPKIGTKLPALLIVQWAGVYGLNRDWATGRAREGWLTLNINAHDLPIDAPADFYKEQSQNALKNYPNIGNTDKETSYFLRMYLSCYRAAEYLRGRDDWDGKTLVVMGTSQGGLQAMMLGGLHPKITAVIANVPAGCDQTGPLAGRLPGWPQQAWFFRRVTPDADKVIATLPYYDVVNFSRHVKCPALIAVGLIDMTCPPAGIFAAANQITGPKEIVVMEKSDHQGRNNSQAAFYVRSSEWLKQLRMGNPPPVPK
jgi:cephalosporin-C deacetylase